MQHGCVSRRSAGVLACTCALAAACAGEPRPAPAPPVVSVPPSIPAATAAATPVAEVDASVPVAAADDPRACDGKCQGKATADIGPAFQTRAAEGRRCYNEALRTTPTLQGQTVVRLRLGADGSICSAAVKTSTMPAEFNDCLLGLFTRQSYPAPAGGCLDVEVPLVFKPMAAPPQAP